MRTSMLATALAPAALLAAALTASAQASGRQDGSAPGFDYELAFDPIEVPYFDRISVAPDGQRIVYAVRRKPAHASTEPVFDSEATPGFYLGTRLYVAERIGDDGRAAVRALCETNGNEWAASWSNDGSKVAFYSDAGGKPGVWIHDGKRCRQLGSMVAGGLLGDGPKWSADDRTLYITVPEHKEPPAQLASSAADRQQAEPKVAAKVVVFTSGDEAGPETAPQPINWNPVRYSIVAVDATTGEARTLVPATSEPSPVALRLSRSGAWLSYLSATVQDGSAGAFHKDLVVVSLRDGTVRTVARGLAELWGDSTRLSYSWHPEEDKLVYWKDGAVWLVDLTAGSASEPRRLAADLGRLESTIYWFTRDGRLVVGTDPVYPSRNDRPDVSPRGLAVLPLDGSKPVTLALDARVEFIGLVMADDRTVWQPDACCLTVQVRDKESGERRVVRYDLRTARGQLLWHGYARIGENVGTSADHRRLFSVYEDLHTPPNIALLSSGFAARKRVASIDPRLDHIRVGNAETFMTTTPGHAAALERVQTTILLPPGARRGDRLPALVMVYPGADLADRIEFFGGGSGNTMPNLLFTSRGYAVVMPQISLGPEKTQNDIAKQMVDSLLPQLYRAAELGYVDIERLALSGQSYGGYGTALIASQTNLFRAGIAINGAFDLGGSYGRLDPSGASINIGWAENSQGRMGTHPWAALQRYLENSPYYRADRIFTPLLIVSGEGDQRVPSEESKRLFTALRRLGRSAQLALYAGEGHVVYEWSQANAIDASKRTMAFLEKYLPR